MEIAESYQHPIIINLKTSGLLVLTPNSFQLPHPAYTLSQQKQHSDYKKSIRKSAL